MTASNHGAGRVVNDRRERARSSVTAFTGATIYRTAQRPTDRAGRSGDQ
jgi:hypothetical protein